MAFPLPPKLTKNELNRAGKYLSAQGPPYTDPLPAVRAMDIVNRWRACHLYPINTFRATLTKKVKVGGYTEYLIAQRLKRYPTIVDKLRRYPSMQLARMQDIGGVRVVLKSPKDVERLVDEYRKSKFGHELVRERDYIQSPRPEDGYRSVHLIYSYKSNRESAKPYNGLQIELQVRTRLQHSWATAVETMGTMLGQALKSRQGEKEWLDFFATVSSAFAHIEKTPLVPGRDHLSKEETFRMVAQAGAELAVIDKMQSYASALKLIGDREDRTRWAYHLIELNSEAHTISIKSYGREGLKRATEDYETAEKSTVGNGKVDTVLVSAGPIEQLRKAYPNYFLDVGEFLGHVRSIIKEHEQAQKADSGNH